MHPVKVLSALLSLSVLAQAQSSTPGQTPTPAAQVAPAQDDQAQKAAARKLLFQRCGSTEASTLPTGIRPGVYRGTLGQQPITLQLIGSYAPDDTQDRYSYDRYGGDIQLERGQAANRTAGDALSEVEAVADDGENLGGVRGCLDLSADGRMLRGQWRSPDGARRLTLTLSPVNVAAQPLLLPGSPGLLALRDKDPYIFLKINRPWTQIEGGLREPLSGVTYPRVSGGTVALNAALQDGQLAMVTGAFDCLAGSGNRAGMTDYQGGGTLSWRSRNLVSLSEQADLSCGGAHPDSYIDGVTLDARSGQAVKLLGKPGTLWPGLSAAKLQTLYLSHYSEAAADAECRDEVAGDEGSDTEYGFPYALYLTPRGLAVWPNYLPHVEVACAEVMTLPYSSLRGFADPKSAYFRDLYSR